ncbi:MAG: response regulator, partial [Bdellovibrionia bacterium]
DTLRIFADQVTSVAREVGIEGRLGGQARVPGAAGTWRDLTDNVNQLAGNLTTQVRAIAEVATAVTRGDLTRSITVGAQGEVQTLKENINQMIANLRDTTHTNKEQDWLKTNLAKFTGMMQGQRSIESLSRLIMSELTPVVSAQHGAFFVSDGDDTPVLRLISSYAYDKRKGVRNQFALGEGLVGQAGLEKKRIVVQEIPDSYIHIGSGLGEAPPRNIVVLPVVFEEQVKAVIELGSFQEFSPVHLTFLDQLTQSIGVVFNMIGASMRTEELLNELQKSNVQLEGRSKELEDKAKQLEVKNREVESASQSLEEKAKELSQISKYKSDFLANMSHELRTPLNSLLILAKMLADNSKKDLPPQAVEYARTIYASGHDLLALINEILDLSKIEAGKMHVELKTFPLAEVKGYVERTFNQVAKQKRLDFKIRISPESPATMTTDILRLQQVIKNLLANAFKFTDRGHVYLDILPVKREFAFSNETLKSSKSILAFSVSDTGIGIPKEKQQLIWEAFQQADTTTARKYGGTGLGLTISRELAKLLGGEIWLMSKVGEGSTFTLFLPETPPHFKGSKMETLPESVGHGAFSDVSRDIPSEEQPFELRTSYVPSTPEAARPQIKSEAKEISSKETSGINLSGKRILIVDDDVRNLFAVTNLLEGHDADVLTAENAHDALELLARENDIDLVLMDIMMPGMDGYEATEQIRKTPGLESLPVVALTAKAMPEDRQKCIESGCSDFVPKPADNDVLLSTVKRWVDRKEKD